MDNITVTQEDLNAAADLIESYWSGADAKMLSLARETRAGHRQGAFPRAFARHRTQALTTARAEAEALRAEVERLREAFRLFPEAHDILTNAERRAAKGNWRSLIDQQTNAIAKALASEPGK